MKEFLKYYHVETTLFDEIRERFNKNHFLDAHDFLCIVIWKSNRPKGKIVEWLIQKSKIGLDDAVKELTTKIFRGDKRERLKILMEVDGIHLAMASAILTALYPDDFTVYDYRVCETLVKHKDISNLSPEKLLDGYFQFVEDVRNLEPKEMSLRDKDRCLWGKSFKEQLDKDIKSNFKK